jgi:curved DNA-binding protein
MAAVGSRDYYDILGVPRDASEEDIRRAYRRLARENHPDVNKDPGAEDRFKEVSEAYETLRDADKRRAYDAGGRGGPAGGGFRGGGGSRNAGDFRDVRVDFGSEGFEDIFEGMFGGGGGFGGGFSRRSAQQEAVLELPLEEAVRGGRRRLTLDGSEYEVDLPPGIRDGQRLRVGDLLLRIRVRPHPRFDVEGRDLFTDLPVAPWEAALGAEIPLRTLDGGTVRVRVPAGSSCGRRLRLRGQGLPGQGGEPPGDLYAEVEIRTPKKLTRQERKLFEQLRDTSKFDPRSDG